jgi:hypothetical protein
MRGLRPFGALLKRYAGKIFLKSRFGHPTAKVGLVHKKGADQEKHRLEIQHDSIFKKFLALDHFAR